MKYRKKIITTMLLLALTLVALCSCGQKTKEAEEVFKNSTCISVYTDVTVNYDNTHIDTNSILVDTVIGNGYKSDTILPFCSISNRNTYCTFGYYDEEGNGIGSDDYYDVAKYDEFLNLLRKNKTKLFDYADYTPSTDADGKIIKERYFPLVICVHYYAKDGHPYGENKVYYAESKLQDVIDYMQQYAPDNTEDTVTINATEETVYNETDEPYRDIDVETQAMYEEMYGVAPEGFKWTADGQLIPKE